MLLLPLFRGDIVKIKILVSIASATWSYAPGDIVDLPQNRAKAWIKSGLAAPYEPEIETASITPPEKRKKVK